MISNARGTHSSPGIYSKEIDLSYASKSIGITTLGVAGETLKGPAFEPIKIENWREFVEYFGGTSAEKFKGTQYPKYELPYIAKSYLTQSNQLEVCRVLGLSGYNAGPAYIITAQEGTGSTVEKVPVVVLRSKGKYNTGVNGAMSTNPCEPGNPSLDKLSYTMKDGQLKLSKYDNTEKTYVCGQTTNSIGTATTVSDFEVEVSDLVRFSIVYDGTKKVNVSLNPEDKDYIVKVLGTSPLEDGGYPFFVESAYPEALRSFAKDKTTAGTKVYISFTSGSTIEGNVLNVPSGRGLSSFKDVTKLLTVPSGDLTADMVGNTYFAKDAVESLKKGSVYEVVSSEGETKYKYEEVANLIETTATTEDLSSEIKGVKSVYVADGMKTYILKQGEIVELGSNLNDYKEQYRYAITPWIVSDLKGSDVKKLFRFATISDGNAANAQVKVSIENIRPDEGLFDVIVRDFYDTDSFPVVLEKFTKCNMVKGTPNYIGLKIGTIDGEFALKSKYIMAEVISNQATESCVPAGFLGYPMPNYDEYYNNHQISYNTEVHSEIKERKQYFGISNLTGIDSDIFSYKGVQAYGSEGKHTNGFHLDSYVTTATTVDGVSNVCTFTTVKEDSAFDKSKPSKAPAIGPDSIMKGTIYENVKVRKFTVCPYGGFDGWDIYRTERTNSNAFRKEEYPAIISKLYDEDGNLEKEASYNFDYINDPEELGLIKDGITSDYYAYLAAIRQFANPEAVDINLLATPGIDYVNNSKLVNEVIDMVEDERGDAVYIVTTPDMEPGEDGYFIYPDEAVANLENSDIDTSYASTYYPWVNYFDSANNVYINLPATKDIVRNIAYTDNTSYPWFAPAGITRGNVDCERARFITKLGDEDELYDGRINPIKTFAADGVKVWGQKTMYSADTPLNRLNVRRLMLRVKKLISAACRRLIFEQNDSTVKAQFESLVKPILNNIKSNRGIYDYRLEINDSAEARDRLELPAVIYIKPTKALEYIDLSFVIMPESAKFDE